MCHDIKVSIVIPVCNVEKYVGQCIESVINQTYKNLEIICVNDGSSDGSLAIMKDFENHDRRIRVIDKKNTGYGNSVNIGISECTGQYLAIIESDDFIDSHMIEDLIAMSENGTVDIIKGNFWDYYDEYDDSSIEYVNLERDHVKESPVKFTLRQNPELLWGHPSIWSAIYRMDFIKSNQISFIEAPGGGWVDNPFFFETLLVAKSIKWTKKPYYHYRKTNINSSSNKQTDLSLPMRRMIDNLNVLKKHNCNDEYILKVAYARAFMYLRGVFLDKHWGKQLDSIRLYGRLMMEEMKESIISNYFNAEDQKLYYDYLAPIDKIVPKNGKILIYNWIQFDNPQKIGGGVNIYCYNLIETIINKRPDLEVIFLSSGWAYDATTTECYIRSTFNVFGERCKSFEVVNSPVPAAQNIILNNPACAFENSNLKAVVKEFINGVGPFKAIHFNNIEGLSLDVLDLKDEYKNTNFIFSAHNYVPFCVTGFYFQRTKKCNCNPQHTAEDCMLCTSVGRRKDFTKEIYGRATQNIKRENAIPREEWLKNIGLSDLDVVSDPILLKRFCSIAVEKINNNMDFVLAVSERVKKLCLDNGIKGNILRTSYIGTKVADLQIGKSVAEANQIFKIGYLGSSVNFDEKGYPFLLSALETFEDELAQKIDLFLTTTDGNPETMKKRLCKFHSVVIKKGYNHSELRDMLADVNLGIVPVLWEDNLPQISIEMVAMGVPVLSSCYGGASELCKNDLFKFEGGNIEDFKRKVKYFVENRAELKKYWENHNGLVTMDKHWNELEVIYNLEDCNNVTIDKDDFITFMKCYNQRSMLQTHDYLQELQTIKNSKAFKLGTAIAFGPRMLKKVYKSYNDGGLVYTLKKIKSKIF